MKQIKYLFGIDIGGTTCKIGLFDEEGNLLEKWQIPTEKTGGEKKVFSDLAQALNDKMKENSISREQILGVGAGVPASVSHDGFVQKCPALGWARFNVSESLGKELGFPVFSGNDANLAAAGEAWKGSPDSYEDAVFVTLGTGVGGGIIHQGKILEGFHGCGGELGHIKVNPHETESCGCSGKGCLQQYASATGIADMAGKAMQKAEKGGEGTYLFGIEGITAKDVFDGAKKGDELCCSVVEKFGEILGRALAGVCVVFDPEVVIIGGGVSAAGQIIIDVVEKYYRKWAFEPCSDMKFVLATLGNDAGIYGCAKMVLSEI